MPIYEYECQSCGNIIEKIHKMSEKYNILFCEKCGKKVKVRKLVSNCRFKLEGGGWSSDGYSKSIDYVKERM